MNRSSMLRRLADETFDVLVVGGGATGLGCAVDAASRGLMTALVEGADFASGTSSRSTKLVHGGVRYLAEGDVHLVREALHERTLLLRNAPHLVRSLAFLTPAYRWREIPYYLTGLKVYDMLAGRTDGFGRSRFVSRDDALDRVSWLRAEDLRGAIEYHDGQFDDARLAIALAKTAAAHGAALANYVRCVALRDGRIATVRNEETGDRFEVRARVVVNACGVFADDLRRLDDPAAAPLLTASRGTHIVLEPREFWSPDAVLVPKTEDGRVIFAIPWHERLLVGTTDVPVDRPQADPQPSDEEIAFLLETLRAYADVPLDASHVSASFAGLRPLVSKRPTSNTARVSREHLVEISPNGLVTIAGGKWTTYRKMAEDTIDAAIEYGALAGTPCVTAELHLDDDPSGQTETLVAERPELAGALHPAFPYTKADAVNGFRNEMARTVEDVLYRRTRIGFLDRQAAQESRATVQALQAAEQA
jgi:glycerol-3-phosphate dehydrogenase